MTDLEATTIAVRTERDVVRVAGPDAASFLQGQLSQNVVALAPATSTWTFVLHPDGKVHTWCRVTRTGTETFVLDVDAGFGERLSDRLRRFLLRTDAVIEPVAWQCISVRGDSLHGPVVAPDTFALPLARTSPEFGFDLLGPDPSPPAGAVASSAADLEQLRIMAGVPAMGAELTDATIPAEVGPWIIEASVDFTKGCYVGQELVARIDSRGNNVPRRLVAILTDTPVEVGTPVTVAGPASVVTSAVPDSPVGPVALAYCGRAVDVNTAVAVGDTAGTVRALPLWGDVER